MKEEATSRDDIPQPMTNDRTAGGGGDRCWRGVHTCTCTVYSYPSTLSVSKLTLHMISPNKITFTRRIIKKIVFQYVRVQYSYTCNAEQHNGTLTAE